MAQAGMAQAGMAQAGMVRGPVSPEAHVAHLAFSNDVQRTERSCRPLRTLKVDDTERSAIANLRSVVAVLVGCKKGHIRIQQP